MRQAVLLGNAGTKRTDYFMQAAQKGKLPVFFVDWKDYEIWKEQLWDGQERIVKIDPPLWESCLLGELDSLVCDYKRKLDEMSLAAKSCYTAGGAGESSELLRIKAGSVCSFLNDPRAIAQLLDKRECKKRLEKAGLAVTNTLAEVLDCAKEEEPAAQLVEIMRRTENCQVFIKPVNGSGAAGVSAFRIQPKTGRMALYTCALEHSEYGLVNTKRLRCFRGRREVFALLNQILRLGCIVERWYAKAQYGEYSYDLRAVVLDRRVEFLLGRLSKGPITNLHLNNHPLEASALGIPGEVLEKIGCLCQEAMGCFPGLRCAGIDLLLEKGSLRPQIIEMNAQGDLMYQDIFHKNQIYCREVEMMKEWVESPDCFSCEVW